MQCVWMQLVVSQCSGMTFPQKIYNTSLQRESMIAANILGGEIKEFACAKPKNYNPHLMVWKYFINKKEFTYFNPAQTKDLNWKREHKNCFHDL